MGIAAADYHFADVSWIDVSGEVLPEHPDHWRANRGEDMAFLHEALGERLVVDYKTAYANPPSAWGGAETAIANNLSQSGLDDGSKYVVEDRSYLSRLCFLLALEYASGLWCNGVPTEKSWSESDYPGSNDIKLLCPEIFTANRLAAMLSGRPALSEPWTADFVKAAYDDLVDSQFYTFKGRRWFDENAMRSEYTTSGGISDVVRGWVSETEATMISGNPPSWLQYVPNSQYMQLLIPPELSSQGKMVTLWHLHGAYTTDHTEYFDAYRLKVTDWDADFLSVMSGMAGDIPSRAGDTTKSIVGQIIGYVVPASGMRTHLNVSAQQGSGSGA
jgi:hypothetical protein